MKILKYIKTLALMLFCIGILTTSSCYLNKVVAEPISNIQQINNKNTSIQNYTNPIDIVNNPDKYINQNVNIKAKFDKFSTLGLDYKPAFRSSDDYISFLIERNDTSHDIPLSEMKLFLKRDLAEEFIELKLHDEIEITGYLFSNALGDVWIDVNKLKIIKKAPDNKLNGDN